MQSANAEDTQRGLHARIGSVGFVAIASNRFVTWPIARRMKEWHLAALARRAVARGNAWTYVTIERGRLRWLQSLR